ncbi:alpha/beta hydrolase [uncultured Rhodoblastus sp.]|uniref:alpha/beta hydrolase n=1 Tax=uncultured Rhodoblastus sp. TaxID=543037 RepID=UPI0025E22BE1|nr:alpha/beta hydrolase [uncultured Rhodoblastus sp.]
MSKKTLAVSVALMGAIAAYAEAGARADTEWRLPGVLFNAIVAEKHGAVARGLAYGPLARQKLDIYRPAPEIDRKAIVIFFYGGGWRRGERAVYRFVGAALAARGYTAVIPDYRLFPQSAFPDFMEDAALSYAWVQRHVATPRERRRIVLMGHSAGAHIAALLALDPHYLDEAAMGAPPPAAVVGLAGPYAFDPTTWPRTQKIFAAAAQNPESARPLAFASAKAPPMLLARGDKDGVVADFNADDMAKALEENGVFVENRIYPGLGHVGLVLTLSRPFRWRAPVLDDAIAFIETALKAPG